VLSERIVGLGRARRDPARFGECLDIGGAAEAGAGAGGGYASEGGELILVAEAVGEVVGMVEVILLADPPDHQILAPRRAAEIHTVVLDRHRGEGVGAALLMAAEKAAAERGVLIIYAGIFAPNKGAVRFYSSAGFGPRGTLLSKEQGAPTAG
jgi:GNAT superfamily N-acetyltransferase